MPHTTVMQSADELVDLVDENETLVVPADYGGSPAEAARALVRAGTRGLHLVGGPPSGYVADLLIGAGCVEQLEMPGVILGDFGLAPRFRAAVSGGAIQIKDTTCPAFHASIAAAQHGVPFMPMRGLIGSDILAHRPEWHVVDNPYAEGGSDPIVLLPAFVPDVVLFHGVYGDSHGNVWVGKSFEVMAMAQAGRKVLATFEYLFDVDLLEDRHMAPSTVSQIYVTASAHVPGGAAPVALHDVYPFDAEHMSHYAKSARTEEGFRRYLDEFVHVKKEGAA